ncbi:MAG: hypothetical protein B7Y98_06950 [Sphingomonas sp. 32-62-10]|nr:MAG: hypothetical protein B7Z43_03850 [Sphingomonas sp. 12-62-6]OYX38853.1 MAG: hypothetical protein B7Y98_06950 [Sphingomonas sp. 32-62-10]
MRVAAECRWVNPITFEERFSVARADYVQDKCQPRLTAELVVVWRSMFNAENSVGIRPDGNGGYRLGNKL